MAFWRYFRDALLRVLSKSTETQADGNLVAAWCAPAPHLLHLSKASARPSSFPCHDNQPTVTAKTERRDVHLSRVIAPRWWMNQSRGDFTDSASSVLVMEDTSLVVQGL